jgi:acyl-CoA dehydrogenase family member 9
MKKAISLATNQAKTRTQFGRPIAEYGLVKQKLGHMVVECYATESVVAMVAGIIDKGYEEYAVEAAISKVFATEALWRTLDEALQVAGGGGYMRELPYERMLRDGRINRIFEGTNDILRLFIALTAMNDVGHQLKEVAKSLGNVLHDPIKGFGVISDYTAKRVSQVTGIGKATMSAAHPLLKEQATIFQDCTQNLSAMVDRLLRKHGKEIVGNQFATRRLADSMIDLFVLASVISRVTAEVQSRGEAETKREREILQVFAGQVGRRVKSNFGKIDNNDDDQIISLANDALTHESYRWDIL